MPPQLPNSITAVATIVADLTRPNDILAESFDCIICTLKDAVKLAPRWPREGPPLWYVSLRCRIEAGHAAVSAMLDRVLAARSSHIPVAPAGRASPTPYT